MHTVCYTDYTFITHDAERFWNHALAIALLLVHDLGRFKVMQS
jgi:hypothetical protein